MFFGLPAELFLLSSCFEAEVLEVAFVEGLTEAEEDFFGAVEAGDAFDEVALGGDFGPIDEVGRGPENLLYSARSEEAAETDAEVTSALIAGDDFGSDVCLSALIIESKEVTADIGRARDPVIGEEASESRSLETRDGEHLVPAVGFVRLPHEEVVAGNELTKVVDVSEGFDGASSGFAMNIG